MKRPQKVDLDEDQVKDLKKRIQGCSLGKKDQELLVGVLNFVVWVQIYLQSAKAKMRRLKNMLGFNSEKRNAKKADNDSDNPEDPDDPDTTPKGGKDSKSNEEADDTKTSIDEQNSKGHGRNSHSKYTSAENVPILHPKYKVGDTCPDECGGKLYGIDPGVVIRITGQPLAKATRYTLEKLRCATCGKVFKSELPDGISKTKKYDETFKAWLSFYKYQMGMPFYRMEVAQGIFGVPLPDATQWDLVKQTSPPVRAVFGVLEKHASLAENFHADDTGVRILSLKKENKYNEADSDSKKGNLRKGMFTTGIVANYKGNQITLFYSGRAYSGENASKIIKRRHKDSGNVFYMSDAKIDNDLKDIPDAILKSIIVCYCLIHGRRKFFDIKNFFPKECDLVLDLLGMVYKNESVCQDQKLSPEDRLSYHQKHSAPLMNKLKTWLEESLESKKIEPNGDLAGAIKYMLRHWDKLTRFLTHAGAPIDNNIVERALKTIIRIRKNSLFFKTTSSARVGSEIVSIIQTCISTGENPIDYMTNLQKHEDDVVANPEKWVPWEYKNRLLELSKVVTPDCASHAVV